VTLIAGITRRQRIEEAFLQRFQVRTVTSPANLAGGASNIVLDANRNVTLWFSPRITDDDIYVFLNSSETKAIYRQDREPVKTFVHTRANDAEAARTKIESLQVDFRAGYGVSLPIQTIKIDHS